MKVLALDDREPGRARTMVVDNVSAATLVPIVQANVAREATVMTDEANAYRKLGEHFAGHGFTAHSTGQYVDFANPTIHTNTVEGYFSIFKRDIKGVYQHCVEQHLQRYPAEFQFRYNHRIANGFNDRQRGQEALAGIVEKRITYRRPDVHA